MVAQLAVATSGPGYTRGIPFAPVLLGVSTKSNHGDGMDTNKNTDSQVRKQSKSKQASPDVSSDKPNQSAAASAVTSVVGTVMQTVATGDSVKGALDSFSKALNDLSTGGAKESVAQVKETFAQAKETVAHAKESFELAKASLEAIRETFKNVLTQVRAKPEPFIAAAVPGILGLFLLFRRSQSLRSGQGSRRHSRSHGSRLRSR